MEETAPASQAGFPALRACGVLPRSPTSPRRSPGVDPGPAPSCPPPPSCHHHHQLPPTGISRNKTLQNFHGEMLRFRSFVPGCDEDFSLPQDNSRTSHLFLPFGSQRWASPGHYPDPYLHPARELGGPGAFVLSVPFLLSTLWSPVALMTSAHLLFPRILISQGTTQCHNAADGCHKPKEVAGMELGGGCGSRP